MEQKPGNAGLRSQYALRLYGWAKKYAEDGAKTISLEELRRVFGLESVKDAEGNVIKEAPLPVWANFQQRALDVALAEVNAKTDLKIKLASIERSKHMGVAMHIGLTSHLDSALKDMCQVILNMGNVREEGCPIGLTPTSTIAVMLAISDAIAMVAKGITKRDYGLRHHGGYLGRVARTDNVDD
jgi:hypothetical protein